MNTTLYGICVVAGFLFTNYIYGLAPALWLSIGLIIIASIFSSQITIGIVIALLISLGMFSVEGLIAILFKERREEKNILQLMGQEEEEKFLRLMHFFSYGGLVLGIIACIVMFIKYGWESVLSFLILFIGYIFLASHRNNRTSTSEDKIQTSLDDAFFKFKQQLNKRQIGEEFGACKELDHYFSQHFSSISDKSGILLWFYYPTILNKIYSSSLVYEHIYDILMPVLIYLSNNGSKLFVMEGNFQCLQRVELPLNDSIIEKGLDKFIVISLYPIDADTKSVLGSQFNFLDIVLKQIMGSDYFGMTPCPLYNNFNAFQNMCYKINLTNAFMISLFSTRVVVYGQTLKNEFYEKYGLLIESN